jgi:hypothetical protein
LIISARGDASPILQRLQRTSEVLASEAEPQLGTVAMTSKPLRAEPLQMMFEGAFADSEHVKPLSDEPSPG